MRSVFGAYSTGGPKRIARFLLLLALPACLARGQTAEVWLPVPAEELALKDNPDRPGSEAMILYRETYTDDTKSFERHHVRIKVFTEGGKKHADVEIPHLGKNYQVEGIRARVVQPDGTAIDFRGQVFDKVVVKSRRLSLQVKTFTLPDVRVGSILEYAWRARWRGKFPDVLYNPREYIVDGVLYVPTARWDLQQELHTRRARFSLRPLPKARLEWIVIRPLGKERPRQQEDGTWLLEMENISGLEAEEWMPPPRMLESEVHLLYRVGFGDFWSHFSKLRWEELEKFVGTRKSIERATAQLVSPDDPSETKLRKLYARVQKVRNLSAEPGALEKPPAANKNVEDVLNRGYAFSNEINFLFVALARAAGFKAHLVGLTSRDSGVFASLVPDARQLNTMVVEVDLPTGPLFLDPATPFCPYGMLPWEETNASGIRMDPRADTILVSTPPAGSETAVTKRTATFRLLPDGALQGQMQVTFTGQEALNHRIAAVGREEASRRKAMEEEVKSWLPSGATVEVSAAGDWTKSEDPLRVECRIQIPNFAHFQGRRTLFSPSVFYAHRPASFRHARRTHPVYFAHAYQRADQITIELPPGFEVESVPTARNLTADFGRFETGLKRAPQSVEFSRLMVMEGIFFRTEFYMELKDFFEKAKASDDEKVVARSAPGQTGS